MWSAERLMTDETCTWVLLGSAVLLGSTDRSVAPLLKGPTAPDGPCMSGYGTPCEL